MVLVVPWSLIWTLGIFAPLVRELRTIRYQFKQPFIMDSRLATEAFRMEPEPLEIALRDAAQGLEGISFHVGNRRLCGVTN
jgi:hypothetical protein